MNIFTSFKANSPVWTNIPLNWTGSFKIWVEKDGQFQNPIKVPDWVTKHSSFVSVKRF
jgi:hypothetical protein